MTRAESRRRCADLVATLDLPEPFDLTALCTHLSERRGRPIVLMPTRMVIGNLCGLWMGTAQADYVFYEEDTSRLHQRHIICHEIGHILLRHSPKKVLSADVARAAAPDCSIRPTDIQRVLGRDTYDRDDEFEAELIASLILSRSGRDHVRETPTATDPAADDIIARISKSLSRGEP
jgi:IrrE N-terminal-like domain